MKKTCITTIICIGLVLISGCSVFVATPHVKHVPVKGVNNEVGEYIIIMNDPLESDLDIKLTDQYAIRLDFQWLWNEQTNANAAASYDSEDNPTTTTPWITVKYNF